MDEASRKELLNFRRSLKVISNTLDAMVYDLNTILQRERSFQPSNNILMKGIMDADKQGINMTKDALFKESRMSKQQFDHDLLELLKLGEIYMLGDVIYPLETLNDKGDTHVKTA
ncbi:MAG: hypothetical protein MUP55_03290 [Candidatus Aenigmarchaeota archaeon]|nr:hypothetical protein [Candidatus Aenigmarchaeota archaeon]